MFFHSENDRISGGASCFHILLLAGFLASPSIVFAESAKDEVAYRYKSERVSELDLAAYEDELLDCSALAGIHTWIGDNLAAEGAEIRKTLAEDYWINVSKGYMALAEQASGDSTLLDEELGVRMKELAAEFRDLTSSEAPANNWADWYDLIDRCDSWRPAKPAHAFYNHGRNAMDQSSREDVSSTG